METKKGKIERITFIREWTGNYGINYVYNCILTNGEYGELNTKTQDKYKVGDEIEYELTSREFNNQVIWQIKVKTPKQQYNGFGGGKTDPNRELSIARQSSLNRACELVIANKIKLDEVIIYSERFVNYIQTGK